MAVLWPGSAGAEDLFGPSETTDEDLFGPAETPDEDLFGPSAAGEDALFGPGDGAAGGADPFGPAAGDDADPFAPAADDDPFGGAAPATAARGGEPYVDEAAEAHKALFAESSYPSAHTCGSCHPRQFEQWSVSQHAYAQMSPVYMAMQNTINAGSSSTNGDFCIRCHNQVGMNKGESPFISNLDRHPASREGITCVVCHRLDRNYGKISGRMAIIEGDLTEPVYGPTDGAELDQQIRSNSVLTTDPEKSGRKIHRGVGHFPYIGESGFCGVCHDVNLFNGFRLEEAFSDFKHSPASGRGESCQDCHMGKVQGKVSGYETGPAAVISGKPTKPRKLTNHFFAGPDYSVIHPGLFPHNSRAIEMATLRDWLAFDHEAGWGTPAFEDQVPAGTEFPPRWASVDDRIDAREVIEEQLGRLDWAETLRYEVLRNGYGMSDIRVTRSNDRAIAFEVDVKNIMDGHSVPTGFDAERLVWLDVSVTDAAGTVVYRSGDLDPNGDVRDTHSLYVHNGELPLDRDLFSLQSKFVTRNLRGGEREQVLALNYSIDPLPFVRPSTRSTILTGQPAAARKHRYVLVPNGSRTARYKAAVRDRPGPFLISVKLKAAMIPVNLIFDIQGVGFDYGMSPAEVARGVVAGHMTLYEKSVAVPAPADRAEGGLELGALR